MICRGSKGCRGCNFQKGSKRKYSILQAALVLDASNAENPCCEEMFRSMLSDQMRLEHFIAGCRGVELIGSRYADAARCCLRQLWECSKCLGKLTRALYYLVGPLLSTALDTITKPTTLFFVCECCEGYLLQLYLSSNYEPVTEVRSY